MEIEVYHTQEYRLKTLTQPVLAKGNEQWLGDGYYFWEEYNFAEWWGHRKKCPRFKKNCQFSIFKALLSFHTDNFIDTVFNENDYNNFVKTIEDFAKRFQKIFHKKPTLEEFNDFIADHKIWDSIKIIRFQDIPGKDEHVEVSGFFYKKRIQVRVNDLKYITNFAHLKNVLCV